MIVFSVILTAIIGFAQTNTKTSNALIKQRDTAYAADGAMDAAINWVKDVEKVGRDPLLYGTGPTADPACVYRKPATDKYPEVTVT